MSLPTTGCLHRWAAALYHPIHVPTYHLIPSKVSSNPLITPYMSLPAMGCLQRWVSIPLSSYTCPYLPWDASKDEWASLYHPIHVPTCHGMPPKMSEHPSIIPYMSLPATGCLQRWAAALCQSTHQGQTCPRNQARLWNLCRCFPPPGSLGQMVLPTTDKERIATVWGQYNNVKLVPWWHHDMEAHDDIIKWKHFLHNWPFVLGNSPVTSEFPSQRPVMQSLMFSLICARTNGWVNNCEPVDLRCHVTDRAGIEPRVARSRVQRLNHWAIKVPERPSRLHLAGSLHYSPLFEIRAPGSGHFQPRRGASTHRRTWHNIPNCMKEVTRLSYSLSTNGHRSAALGWLPFILPPVFVQSAVLSSW